MALIHCTECQQQISDQADACPHCGMPTTKTAAARKGMDCPYCKVPYVQVQRTRRSGFLILLTGPLFLIGLIVLLFNFIGGLVVIALAVIIDTLGRGKETALVCPKCKGTGTILS